MKNVTTILVAILVLGTCAAQAQPAASCVIRVESDSSTLPLHPDMVTALARSTGVVNAALGPHLETLRRNDMVVSDLIGVDFTCMERRPDLLVGQLSVEVNERVHGDAADMDLANDLLRGLCTQLSTILEQTGREDQEHLVQKLATADRSLARARAELEGIQRAEQELCAAAGRYRLDRDVVLREVENWRQKKQLIEMELQALAARRSAVAQQIAEVGERAEKEARQDPVVAELEKVVALRQERLTHAMKLADKDLASSSDVQQAQEEVAKARAELAQCRQSAVQRAGGGWLSKLNEALMTASSDLLSRNAELKTVETLLADIEERKLLELVNRYDREARLEREMAEDAVREALDRMQRLTQELRSYRGPRVTVLGLPE